LQERDVGRLKELLVAVPAEFVVAEPDVRHHDAAVCAFVPAAHLLKRFAGRPQPYYRLVHVLDLMPEVIDTGPGRRRTEPAARGWRGGTALHLP
jgi:hypothetical protein